MRPTATELLTLGGLATLSILVMVAASSLSGLDGKVSQALTNRDNMQTLTQKVVKSNGDEVTVVTTRLDGESVADFIARHAAVVEALKAS